MRAAALQRQIDALLAGRPVAFVAAEGAREEVDHGFPNLSFRDASQRVRAKRGPMINSASGPGIQMHI